MAEVLTASMPLPTPRALWRNYNASLERRPIQTKALTSLAGFALGDAIAQYSGRPRLTEADGPPWRYDYYRTLRLAAYGGAIAGPLGHHWFSFLDARIFPQASKSPQAILSKIIADQAVMTPFGSALFYAVAKVLDLQPEAIVPTIQEKLLPTMQASLKLWPIAHAVNFAFIPSTQRLLYINIISIFWTVLLSQQASSVEGTSVEAVMSSPPQLVVVPVQEDEQEVLASAGFLDDMEALEAEYDRAK